MFISTEQKTKLLHGDPASSHSVFFDVPNKCILKENEELADTSPCPSHRNLRRKLLTAVNGYLWEFWLS